MPLLLCTQEVALRVGDRLTLTTDSARASNGTKEEMYVSYEGLAAQARPGQVI